MVESVSNRYEKYRASSGALERVDAKLVVARNGAASLTRRLTRSERRIARLEEAVDRLQQAKPASPGREPSTR